MEHQNGLELRHIGQQKAQPLEITPPHHWKRKANTGIWAGFNIPTKPLDGFSDSPSANGIVEGQYKEPTEDEIAEKVFDWWISGKGYKRWFADTFLQLKIKFDEEE